MAENTNEEPVGEPAGSQSENSSEEAIATNETAPITQNQKTVNMEVHHHPDLHHKPKKWKEYFLEFLMIFLAVTLGFFAEALREHIGDRNKEKEYLYAMVSELQYDTAQYKQVLRNITYMRPILDSLYINATEAKRFNYVLQGRWNTPINEQTTVYQPSLTTTEQLKSSGNLRLIEDKNISNKIIGYATFVQNRLLQTRVADMMDAVNNVYEQEDAISNEAEFNSKLDENIRLKTTPENSALFDLPLLVKDSVTLNRLGNSFINLKARNYGYSVVLGEADSLATQLIQLINSKYHFNE